MKAERNRPAQGQTTRTASQEPQKDKGRRMLPERSNAWDPFEVWKTRVKPNQGGKDAQ